jgi:hypothetical protein
MVPQVWMDIAVVIGMFVLRVGVPVALTIALGKWLEKKLSPQAEKPVVGRSNSKVIQLHCWDMKRCEPTTRAQCAAYKHPDLPCWLAIQAEGGRVRAECFECAFYKPQTKAA